MIFDSIATDYNIVIDSETSIEIRDWFDANHDEISMWKAKYIGCQAIALLVFCDMNSAYDPQYWTSDCSDHGNNNSDSLD